MSKFTFLIPAFKIHYLENALESILSQTYDDFKVIVSNDCSPYDIKSIVDKFKDDRILYRENSENIGGERLVDHWNLLVELCDTPYLIMASDDDIYEKDFLKEVNALTENYPEADIIRSRTSKIDNQGNVIETECIFDTNGSELDAAYNSFCANQIWCVGNYVFKTKRLKEVGGFVKFPFAWFSDLSTALLLSKNGICYTYNNGFKFRLAEENISNTKKNKCLDKQKLYATVLFGEWLSEYIRNIDVSADKLSTIHKGKVIHSSKSIIYSQIGDYSWSIGYRDLLKVYSTLKKYNDFSKFSFLKNFLLAVLARKIGKYV